MPLDLNNPNEAIVAQRFTELDSTNAEALRQLRSVDDRPAQRSFIVSEHQTAGRGQAGNGWHDTPGKNLLSTLVYYPEQLRATDLFAITQVSSLAILDAVEQLTGLKAFIKWPNDILVAVPSSVARLSHGEGSGDDQLRDAKLAIGESLVLANKVAKPVASQISKAGKEPRTNSSATEQPERIAKVCGLLIQNSLSGQNVQWTIIGAGLNVNENDFPSELRASATSLRQLVGHELDLSTCEATYFATLLAKIDHYLEPLNRIGLQRDYLSRLYRLNEKANYLNVATNTTFKGTIRDVDPSGQLVVEHQVGRLQRYGLKEIRFL